MVRPTSETTIVTMNLAREPLPKTTAIQLFKSLFLARRSEEYIVKHYPENQMRTPMHMSMGQEFVPVAVGAAFANLRLGTGRTSVAFFGDGAADAGVFWESINSAALFQLPVMFVCEDNGYAVDTPREARQASRSLGEAVKPFGADTYEDDSGDVESVYSLAKEAADKAIRASVQRAMEAPIPAPDRLQTGVFHEKA